MTGKNPDLAVAPLSDPAGTSELHRSLDWRGAYWVSNGVPAGVLLTNGGIATVIGQPSWVVCIASILIGLLQSFIYTKIAALYSHKSGGGSRWPSFSYILINSLA
jgi:amino acid transporter